MPTIIALDVSLSMTRLLPGNNPENLSYHSLAVKSILQFLDYLTVHSKLEFVSLIVYSTLYEVIVDFTRDYDAVRQELNKIEHYDKTCIENALQAINNILISNWGSQNYCQVLVITDCGIGMGQTSLTNTIINLQNAKKQYELTPETADRPWLPFMYPSKLNFLCLGLSTDPYFSNGTHLYQQLLNVSGQNGQLYIPTQTDNFESIRSDTEKETINNNDDENKREIFYLKSQAIIETVEKLCEINYKPFEATLKCGSYFKLECEIMIWPPPLPYIQDEQIGTTIIKKNISKNIQIAGYISLSEIGSPMSISRHLIFPQMDTQTILSQQQQLIEKTITTSGTGTIINNIKLDKTIKNLKMSTDNLPINFEKLETEIKNFYAKNTDGNNSDDENLINNQILNDSTKESVCVLLHGALKVENMAALVLLNDNWFGFIYSYADSKKKSNLMLTVLPPGYDIIPWLGDIRYLGTIDDAIPNENPCFPVKPEKRSYSQNCVVWIRQAGIQSDMQKVLRHAKKLPEKTQHFYKELNRIRRAALSLGFVELLEGLSVLFEREILALPSNSSPDCALQLKHAVLELRKVGNRDLKTVIAAIPTKYNQ